MSTLPPYVKQFLENCSHMSLSKAAITAMYETIVSYEASIPEDCRLISEHIPCVSHLHALLKAVCADRMHDEGWRRSIVDLNNLHFHLLLAVPINTTGTFQCPLVLLRHKLDKIGTRSILPFGLSQTQNGERTYSNPCDSETLEKYCAVVGTRGLLLCVDINFDGIALPNGGSQTMSPLRIRVSNLKGIKTVWFEIGLRSTLLLGNTMCSSGKISNFRGELLHRYLFMVLHPLIDVSNLGYIHHDAVIFPQILTVLSDQKQERSLIGLKSSNSTRDFTACEILSRLTPAEK